MNIEHINNIIKKPETLNYTEDLPLVKELIESFPYFAPGYAMLTKMLHAENSVYLDKYLHLTAAYIGDREVLYNYLYPPQKEEEERRAKATTLLSHLPENTELEEAPPAIEEIIEKQLIEETLAIDVEPAPELHIDIEESHVGATEELQSGENAPEIIQPVEEIENTVPEVQSIEEKTLTENSLPETEEEKQVAPKPELEITPLAAYDYFSAVGKPDVEEHIQEPFHLKPVPAYEEEVIDSEPHSFQEWIEWLEHKKLAAKAKTEFIIDKINSPAQDKTQIDDIINSFIRKEPRIKPPQTKFFKPEDMAQQSAVEDFSFVTETLANIYLQQELYAKATEAFRRLIDKHPDRREYFEEKISEVEKAKKPGQ